MIRFFRYLGWALGLLPKVIELVKAIEAAAPVAKQGKQKLELLKAVIIDIYNESKDDKDGLSLEEVLKLATMLTNRLVAFFNATGIFAK